MRLESNVSSDRSWVYHSPADLSDEEPRAETFAIRFGNSERMYKAPSLSLSLARSLALYHYPTNPNALLHDAIQPTEARSFKEQFEGLSMAPASCAQQTTHWASIALASSCN
jgi:hypothetical protein